MVFWQRDDSSASRAFTPYFNPLFKTHTVVMMSARCQHKLFVKPRFHFNLGQSHRYRWVFDIVLNFFWILFYILKFNFIRSISQTTVRRGSTRFCLNGIAVLL